VNLNDVNSNYDNGSCYTVVKTCGLRQDGRDAAGGRLANFRETANTWRCNVHVGHWGYQGMFMKFSTNSTHPYQYF
jgi:hypothetical protein